MARETVRNAIAQLTADKQQLESRIRQIDQSIQMLESVAHRNERLSTHPHPSAPRPANVPGWLR